MTPCFGDMLILISDIGKEEIYLVSSMADSDEIDLMNSEGKIESFGCEIFYSPVKYISIKHSDNWVEYFNKFTTLFEEYKKQLASAVLNVDNAEKLLKPL